MERKEKEDGEMKKDEKEKKMMEKDERKSRKEGTNSCWSWDRN